MDIRTVERLLPFLSAATAGSAGYFLTPSSRGWKRRLRNAALSALAGGFAGSVPAVLQRFNGASGADAAAPKPTDAAVGESLAESIARAAEIHSIRQGGGGETSFPNTPAEMRGNLPPVVAKSLEGCFSDKPSAHGGYVARYVPNPARGDFEVVVSPASGHTGTVFRVGRDYKVRRDK